jgi:peptidoglycan/xylan/chitin deacetylase (PgdA/CDA1 family)
MRPDSLRGLIAEGHEVGAHGVSHHTLPKFRAKELTREVLLCKTHLQDAVGEEVQMFCYPKGRYSARVIREVKKAGYAGARTTEMLGHHLNFDPYRMSTTIQVYPHTKTQYLRNLCRSFHFGRALHFAADLRRASDWVDLAKVTFDRVLQDGGVWHLYGHSWEIEELNLWNDLGTVLSYVSKRPGVMYVTNREVLKFLPANKRMLFNAARYCKDESLPRP